MLLNYITLRIYMYVRSPTYISNFNEDRQTIFDYATYVTHIRTCDMI